MGLLKVRSAPLRKVASVLSAGVVGAGLLAGVTLGAVVADAPAAVAASSCGGSLGAAGTFNEFATGAGNRSSSDIEGRAAYGGNLDVTSFNFGSALANDPSRLDLVVGNNINVGGGGGQISHGAGSYGGTLNGPGTLGHPVGALTHTAPPFSFSTEGSNLSNQSIAIATLAQNGTVVQSGSGFIVLTLTGTDATQNVFNLTAAQLAGVNEVDIKVPFGSTTLVNVTGNYSVTTKPLNAVKIWNGTSFEQASGPASANFTQVRSRLLWNFSTATAVTIATNMAFQGTVLAPLATISMGFGQTNGSVIGASVTGTGQVHNYLFDPNACLPVGQGGLVPEVPFAVVLPLGAIAVGAVWMFVRRRAAVRALVMVRHEG